MNPIKEISISPFDNHRWLVSTPNDNHILVNNATRKLLNLLKDSTSETNALNSFNQEFNQTLNQNEFRNFIQSKLGKLDVLSTDSEPFKKASYLNLKVKLLNSKMAGWMAAPFSWMFHSFIFWSLFVTSLLFLTWLSATFFRFDKALIQADKLILYTVILYSTMLIHEIGHIAACRKFKVQHGEIGFGFYLFFPVLYADVSNIWKLSKYKRIITNLGGIYLELIYAFILGIVFLSVDQVVFLYVAISIFIKCLLQLNPFIRYDGYWVLSDLMNTPNLLPRSRIYFKQAWKQKSLRGFKTKHILILMYGSANWLLILGYLIWIVKGLGPEILYFPGKVYHAIREIFRPDTSFIIDLLSFKSLLLVGFYLMILKLGIGIGKKIIKSKRYVATPPVLKGVESRD